MGKSSALLLLLLFGCEREHHPYVPNWPERWQNYAPSITEAPPAPAAPPTAAPRPAQSAPPAPPAASPEPRHARPAPRPASPPETWEDEIEESSIFGGRRRRNPWRVR